MKRIIPLSGALVFLMLSAGLSSHSIPTQAAGGIPKVFASGDEKTCDEIYAIRLKKISALMEISEKLHALQAKSNAPGLANAIETIDQELAEAQQAAVDEFCALCPDRC